jgi:hypothetical protein
MIDKTLTFLLGEVNTLLGAVFPSSEPNAVLSALALTDGSAPPGIENKIVMTVANIERESSAISRQLSSRLENGAAARLQPPLNLNVYFLLSASFTGDYVESLRVLSTAVGFLQSKPVFTAQNSAAFPRGLERLTVEMVNLDIQALQNLWAGIGAKYLPSVYYKARMLAIQDGWIAERTPVITETSVQT